jgi:hypothetical protein
MKVRAVLAMVVMLVSTGAFATNFALAVTVSPIDSGWVTLDPTMGPCVAGAEVTLAPVAKAGFRFDHWEGSLTGADSPATLIMDADKHVTAVFVSENCLLDAVTVVAPRNGAVVTVANGSGELPLVLVATTNCVAETDQVTFTLDGVWQSIALSATQNDLYLVTGPKVADVGYGDHTLLVSASSELRPNVLFQDLTTFTLVAAASSVDGNQNGLADDTFSVMNFEGAAWMSSVIVPDTRGERVAGALRWDGLDEPESHLPVVVSVKNPNRPPQTVTASAPRGLLRQGEIGVLLVQTAPDLPTLFSSLETSLLGPEPFALIGGGLYVEVSVLVSVDDGEHFTELDSARFDEQPIHLTITALDTVSGGSALLYSHETRVVRNPVHGDEVVAWIGEWDTDSVRNLIVGDGTLDADLVFLSVCAPYDVPLAGPRISTFPPDQYTQAYGWVRVGSYGDAVFTVRNTGGGTLTGEVLSTAEPFTIISGGVYSLGPGKSQKVAVRFRPPASEYYTGSIVFSGAGGASVYVSGQGYAGQFPLACIGGTRSSAFPDETVRGAIGDLVLLLGVVVSLLLVVKFRSRASANP